MNIAVDCRYLGKSGIGRVCEGIIGNLDYSAHKFYLIGNVEKLKKYDKAVIVEDDGNPFSAKGLLKFNKKLINNECKALIIPNFIIPYGIKIPVHPIIHDLIFLDLRQTTRGFCDRLIKKTLIKRCINKSKTIACDSGFTLSRCKHYFGKKAKKCYVNYPALSANILEYAADSISNVQKDNTLVFVGNVKPHKGLPMLISVMERLKGYKLKIIGERDNFLTGLKIDDSSLKNVEFTGRISDDELFGYIKSARYLIQPSLYEGFGLPPLEAMYLGTQPIISDIEVFREVYKDFPVVFFKGEEDLTEKICAQPQRVDCADKILNKYNYKAFAEKIITYVTR